jgi:tellurite resistance protein
LTVRDLPIGYYGAVMGLVGLGLAARAAAPLFPGVVRAPAYFTEPWVALGMALFLVLVPAYALKVLKYPGAVKEDFTNPILLGFCGALPVGMALVAGGVAPYFPALGSVLWWIAFALLLAFQVWALMRFFRGGIALTQVNAGWLILLVGGIVLPGPGVALGHAEASRIVFGISGAAAAVLVPLLLYRALAAPPLPPLLSPSWFILLVPPSLIYANGVLLYPNATFLENLYFVALAFAVGLFYYARSSWRWPYGAPWWAFTFPLDALAYAAARYAQDHPGAVWKAVAGVALGAATVVVTAVLLRWLFALLRGTLRRV